MVWKPAIACKNAFLEIPKGWTKGERGIVDGNKTSTMRWRDQSCCLWLVSSTCTSAMMALRKCRCHYCSTWAGFYLWWYGHGARWRWYSTNYQQIPKEIAEKKGEWDLFFILIGCPIEGKDKVATCFVGIAELAWRWCLNMHTRRIPKSQVGSSSICNHSPHVDHMKQTSNEQ
jgi:hypothetical protein